MAGLESLYRDIILDHYRNPRRRGELASPPAVRCEGFNPLCGDEVVLTLEITDGVVKDLAVDGQGCSISQASSSMMSQAVVGKSINEVRRLAARFKAMMGIETGEGTHSTSDPVVDDSGLDDSVLDDSGLGDLEALRGVVKFPVRIKCAALGWNTLLAGLEEADAN